MSAKTGYLQASSSQWENLVPLVHGSVIVRMGLLIVIDTLKTINGFLVLKAKQEYKKDGKW